MTTEALKQKQAETAGEQATKLQKLKKARAKVSRIVPEDPVQPTSSVAGDEFGRRLANAIEQFGPAIEDAAKKADLSVDAASLLKQLGELAKGDKT